MIVTPNTARKRCHEIKLKPPTEHGSRSLEWLVYGRRTLSFEARKRARECNLANVTMPWIAEKSTVFGGRNFA